MPTLSDPEKVVIITFSGDTQKIKVSQIFCKLKKILNNELYKNTYFKYFNVYI